MRGNHLCRTLSLAAILFSALSSGAQSAATTSIDVATIKPHPAAILHNNFRFARNRFELEDQPLLKLIAFAYAVNPKQIVDAPAWIADQHWDMRGTTSLTEDATLAQQQQLIRQLLTERFGLTFHHDKREMSAYALQLDKGQPKLTASANPAAQPLEHTDGHDSIRIEEYRSSTITYFLTIRQLFMDRPLLDQTGLTGIYDFDLTYSFGDAPSTEADAPPPMFTAMKEELGLKFEPVKAPVDVMVIDHIDKPTAN
jgi:uncharacterized protein (TIGR03435 family)